jgi:hypothetical protein
MLPEIDNHSEPKFDSGIPFSFYNDLDFPSNKMAELLTITVSAGGKL